MNEGFSLPDESGPEVSGFGGSGPDPEIHGPLWINEFINQTMVMWIHELRSPVPPGPIHRNGVLSGAAMVGSFLPFVAADAQVQRQGIGGQLAAPAWGSLDLLGR